MPFTTGANPTGYTLTSIDNPASPPLPILTLLR